jgi:hypothetical protein
MCYEDVKEGLRRWTRLSADVPNATEFRADKRRVAIKLLVFATNATDNSARAMPSTATDRNPFLYVNAGHPVDEVWLERHGDIVQSGFVVNVSGNCSVLEVFNSELDHPPAAGNPYDSVSRSK